MYLLHGQVVIDGLVEIGPGAAIAPWVTIGLRAGDVQGATIGRDVNIGTGREGDRPGPDRLRTLRSARTQSSSAMSPKERRRPASPRERPTLHTHVAPDRYRPPSE